MRASFTSMAGVLGALKAQAVGLVAALATMALLAAFVGLAGGMAWSTLEPDTRRAVQQALRPHLAFPLVLALGLAAVAAALATAWARRWRSRWLVPAVQLADGLQLLLAGKSSVLSTPLDAGPQAATPLHHLAAAVQSLARRHHDLQAGLQDQVDQASHHVAQERNRLAALMSELSQAVVVCNLDGSILLYNARARLQLRALSGEGAWIGLGRSIYAVFERSQISHALEHVQQGLQRGVARPHAQFVTSTRSGQLLRVQLAAVREEPGSEALSLAAALDGFVLMLDNITRSHELEQAREQAQQAVVEGLGQLLARQQALQARLAEQAGTRPLADEVQRQSQQVQALALRCAALPTRHWPLEEMLGADLVQAAQRRIAADTGLRCELLEQEPGLWLQLDSFALLQALVSLATRLRDELGLARLQLRLQAHDARRAALDLVWTGPAISSETVMGWELDPMCIAGERSPGSVRDVVRRHGAALAFERDRVRGLAWLRLVLPRAAALPAEAAADPQDAAAAGGPAEYYDFGLFRRQPGAPATPSAPFAPSALVPDWPLDQLSFTVFDCETTGMDPSGGDEILQIAAVRVLHGRVRLDDRFDRLVDPGRPIPQASIAIHGITPAMLQGQPPIHQVLPAFEAFAQDSVLVAHNAAFDLRFLQLKQQASGCRFDHRPVLDTLLLSALLQPEQTSHSLEAMASRLGVAVQRRHCALADAQLTAELLCRMLPLLAARGIHTLGQAMQASQQTPQARLRY